MVKGKYKKFGYNDDGTRIETKIDLLNDESINETPIHELIDGLVEDNYTIGETLHTMVIYDFPTHIAKTKNKIKENKFIKINNQAIYNDALNRFSRAIAINNLKDYVSYKLCNQVYKIKSKVTVNYEFHTVINHGDIRRKNGTILWKIAKDDYRPCWDISNLAFIWMKVIDDTLEKLKIITNDNVKFVSGGSYQFVEVKDYRKRKIVIRLNKVE